MGGLMKYSYKYVMPNWDCVAALKDMEFNPPIVQYSTSLMRNTLIRSDNISLRIIAARCTDLDKDNVARQIRDTESAVRLSLLENFHVFEYDFNNEDLYHEYSDLLQIVRSGQVDEARAIAQNINFTFYNEEIQQALLDYDDLGVDRAMISCELKLESLIELSRRRDEDIAQEAQEIMSYLFDTCLKWSCKRLIAEITSQLGQEVEILMMFSNEDSYSVRFKEQESGQINLIQADYRNRQWELSLVNQ